MPTWLDILLFLDFPAEKYEKNSEFFMDNSKQANLKLLFLELKP